MSKIGRFLPFGKRFFRRARKSIDRWLFAHFRRVVMTLAAMNARRSLLRIAEAGKDRRLVSKIFLHAEKVYAHGRTIFGCALIYPNETRVGPTVLRGCLKRCH